MIEDKVLGEIVGRESNQFTEEEYPLLRKQYEKELKTKHDKDKVDPPPPPEPPPIDKTKLQEEKNNLEAELNILQLQGYDALQKYREENIINNRISQINEQLLK